MTDNLQKIIKHENAMWSRMFQDELNKNSDKKFSSFWWEDYYKKLTGHMNQLMLANGYNAILEAGSGSGKTTILLNKNFHKTLLDISSVALKYAKHMARKFNAENVNFVEGNIFSMPFENKSFDFVWNIGVIEHYQPDDIKSIIREMVRVCDESGIVAAGLPNFYSGPILKAWFLKIFKIFPGYRLGTENFYKAKIIENIFRDIGRESGKKITYIKTEYFGNPLIMETPEFILKTAGRLISFIFGKNKFLMMIICKFG